MKAKSSRGILMKLICCTALVVFTSVFAFSQTPKSGALLSIDGTGASSGVHVRIYDSQIHSGHVQAAPTCGAGDQIPTDAYVLQGGSATGCDTGDAFEVTDGGGSGDHNTSLTHQDPGQKDLFGFRIATHYLSVPVVSITSAQPTDDGTTTTYSYTRLRGDDIAAGENIAIGGFPTIAGTDNGNFSIISVTPGSFVTDNSSGVPYTFSTGPDATGTASTGASGPSVAVCNHDGSICASPDTGFLTVTNNTESPFTGTISLTGTSTGCGAAPDSVTYAEESLANGSSVTLALSTDSSNCGGFNQPQPLPLTANATSTAFFGKDDYQFTPLNSGSGDTLTILPVPVPAGPLTPTGCTGAGCVFGSESPIATSPLRFSAGTNFAPTKYACVPYADFSAQGNPVCVELKVECTNGPGSCTDANNILYKVQNDYNIDANSLPNGVGGPAFIGQHGVPCPATAFDINIFTSYTAPSVSFDPLKGSGGGTGSCWVVAFDPSVAAVTTGNTVSTFAGFTGLLAAPAFNLVHPGAAETLNFTYKMSSGSPVTNLHLCPTVVNNGSTCVGVQRPWVAFGTLAITGCTTVAATDKEVSLAAGGSNLQNFGAGSYRFNWKTSKTATLGNCVVVVAAFDTGEVEFPDYFKYVK